MLVIVARGRQCNHSTFTRHKGVMVATDSALRITIRIDIPDSAYPSTCIDLAVPRNSSIAEILDEVLTLADAPRISRPW